MIKSTLSARPAILFGLFFLSLLWNGCRPEFRSRGISYDYSTMDKETARVHREVETFLYLIDTEKYPINLHPATRIDSIRVDRKNRALTIWLNKEFSFSPFREDNVAALYTELGKTLSAPYKKYSLQMRSMDIPVEQLVPNYYRQTFPTDSARLAVKEKRPAPIVRPAEHTGPGKGLYGNNIALWHSHGWYYDQGRDRWMWQRARLFGTVEDLMPGAFTIPYLIPMLEKAGANVFVPRERDINASSVIVDNDTVEQDRPFSYSENRQGRHGSWRTGATPGYGRPSPFLSGTQNPFRLGSWRHTRSDSVKSAWIRWTPSLPDSGYYAVYISYHADSSHVDDARYRVHHAGGHSDFLVNQQIGGGTWIYLGTFKFNAGYNPQNGSVELTNRSARPGRIVSADAVKFGGGMGHIIRNGSSSGRPAYTEGARYWMQAAGFPDSLVYNLNDNQNDYKDDYQGRGEWANYLHGAPAGPNRDRSRGLGIPIDLSLAFHTDAGITRSDTAIGTLLIYSLTGADTLTVFPDGRSRLASRDFSDILQTQVVEDIRALYDPTWPRRSLREAQYSEAYRPNIPAALLELLSHQNWADSRFMLDPRFRFDVSRAIYKAMLRFIASAEQRDYVVAPLPVNHFSARLDEQGNIVLSWQAVVDPLEETAVPTAYKVYTRIDDGGFDDGVISTRPAYTLTNPKKGHIYSFKVCALNEGGESLPSEILSVGLRTEPAPTLLVVNGFDRISGPATLSDRTLSGFDYSSDNGVPDRYDLSFTGEQFDYLRRAPFVSNDRPGHGASYADAETKIIAGNTFDYPYVHGRSIFKAGYNFVSASDEALTSGQIKAGDYPLIDLIMGEEKSTSWPRAEMDTLRGIAFTVFPAAMKRVLRRYLAAGGSLLLSGAYIGSDLFRGHAAYDDALFARDVLKFRWVTGHAARTGRVFSTRAAANLGPPELRYNSGWSDKIYRVEAPDAIRGVNGGQTAWRFAENGFGAGTIYKKDYGVAALTFPLETLVSERQRDKLIKALIDYLLEKE